MKSAAWLGKILFYTLSLCIVSTTTYASTPSNISYAQQKWQLKLIPYLWATNMDGTIQLGNTRSHINESFTDILKHLDIAGMIWLEADKGDLGIFFNAMYAALSDTASDGTLALNAKARLGLFSGGLSYHFQVLPQFTLTPYAGARYTALNNSLNASIPTRSVNLSDRQGWIDPLIGLRAFYRLNPAWSLNLAGDIGGTKGTDHSYNATGLIGYQPQTVLKNVSFHLGYRLLKQLYKTGSGTDTFLWNMKIAGPLIGVEIRL